MKALAGISKSTATCYKCGEEKEFSEFHKNKSNKSGINRICKPCGAEYKRVQRSRDPEGSALRYREWFLMSKYGITIDQFDGMWESQGGRCEICQDKLERCKGGFAVDHDHLTHRVRSLLCNRCNPGVGYFRDSPDLLRVAANYIERHRSN